MQAFRKCCLYLAGAVLLAFLAGLATKNAALWQPAAAAAAASLAIGLRAVPALKGYQFTAWIIAAVVCPMIYPESFLHPFGLNLRNRWVMLVVIQLVMFGMGTQMSLKDFAGVARMPYGVVVGLVCQFTIMPLVGFGLAKGFGFPPEIGAGIVLIGSCSSGLASNVMNYLARANLGLSITVTAFATLLAPLMTPLWMKWLAGSMVEVEFFKMMADIIKMVIVPIGAAMLHDYLRHAPPAGRRTVHALAWIGAGWMIFLAVGGWGLLQSRLGDQASWAGLAGFLIATPLVGVVYHHITRLSGAVQGAMPVFSMFGIIYFTAVTTAAGRNELLAIGGLLVIAAMLHNTAGYVLGYWMSRAMGLNQTNARTVAIEVGLQNGGMASGLAAAMGKLGTVGLASAIFSPWMNVSGSILANYWRKKAVKQPSAASR
jgi:BASS family bile acid:Na+ symporter